MLEQRICSRCKKLNFIEAQFRKCAKCRESGRKHNHTPKGKDRKRRFTKTLPSIAAGLIKLAKHRAKENGGICSLTKEWALAKLKTGICEATRVKFVLIPGVKNMLMPTIDRIDSDNKNYTPETCQLVTKFYNQMKNVQTAKQCGSDVYEFHKYGRS